MKKLFTLLLLFVSVYSFSKEYIDTSRVYIISGDSSYPPYDYTTPKGKITGFNVELAKTVMGRLGLKYQLQRDNYLELNDKLKSEEIDLATSYIFSNISDSSIRIGISHCLLNYAIITTEGTSINCVDSLREKRIIVQHSSTALKYLLEKNIDRSHITLLNDDEYSGLDSLLMKKCDAVIMGAINARYIIKKLHIGNLTVSPADFIPQEYVFCASPKNQHLIDLFDREINKMKNDGTYSEIYDRWIGPYEERELISNFRNYIVILFIILTVALVFIIFFRLQIRIATRALSIAKDKAESSDRLKSVFLANMSHEIRTPLNAIVGFSELMTSEEDPQMREMYKGIITQNNELLLQLIGDILDLSKIEAGTLVFNYEICDIRKMFQEFEITASQKCPSDKLIMIRLDTPNTPLSINTDKNRLLQVMNNFLTNAIKFTETGTICFGYKIRQNDIYFYLRDTGCGISPEQIPLVFERFVKFDNFKSGTGLGLAISQMIIRRFKGEIGVKSELGTGSEFWFTLPR